VRFIAHGVDNLGTNFCDSAGTFRSRNTCQKDHMTSRPWTLTLEIVALVSDTGLRVPSYQVGLSVRKIWRTSGLSISRPAEPRNWCALFLQIFVHFYNFSFSTYRPIPVRQSDASRDLAPLVGDAGLRPPSVYQVWSSYAFPFGKYCAFTVWALVGLVTLNFDPLTSKKVHKLHILWRVSTLPVLGFVDLSVLKL